MTHHKAAKTRYEQDDGGTETSTERRVMFSPEISRQIGEAKAEWKILCKLAAVVDPGRAHLLGCETGWKIREEIAQIVPYYDGVQHLHKTGDVIQYGGTHFCAGAVTLVPIARGNLQIHWPEGDVIIQCGVVDEIGGVPGYNALVRIEGIEQHHDGQPQANSTDPKLSHDETPPHPGEMSHIPPFGETQ